MRNFKKTMSVLLAAIMAFSAFSAVPITASAAEVDGKAETGAAQQVATVSATQDEATVFRYEVLEDGTAEITGYNGDESELVIPSEIDGYKVTEIGFYAFYNCESISQVKIPESVTIIGIGAFSHCSNITDITISKNVNMIGDFAFDSCSNLKKVEIPYGVTGINYSTFYNCSSLKNIIIPNSVTYITTSAFQKCSNLTSVTIPESVNKISMMAFADCSSLTEIRIPKSVTEIGILAFSNCNDNITIYGYTNTVAEKYAIDNNINFISLDEKTIGNINGDGTLSVADATAIQKYLATITELTPEQLVLADYNGDGVVNVNDATAIQRELVNS